MIEVWAVGGYTDIGKNMTAVRYNNEVVIFDIGVFVDKLISYEGDAWSLHPNKLLSIGALPDDTAMNKEWGKFVKAIVCTHAHLDHLGGLTKIASHYKDAPIIGTPYTIEVLKNQEKDQKGHLDNKTIKMSPGNTIKITPNISIEFIYATHSTLQTIIAALHTPEGTVIYANDWKFDDNPTYGQKTDYARLRKLGNSGVVALISDSTRIDHMGRTFSEGLAAEMLKDLLLNMKHEHKLVVLTTFASHCVRISNMIKIAKKMGRTPIILGRSMKNYLEASTRAKLISFKDVPILSFGNEIEAAFKMIEKQGREKFVLIMTGNQGEPDAMLTKMARNELSLKLEKGDVVVFCSEAIPVPVCIANRQSSEKMIRDLGVHLFVDIHVSGHASREDQLDLLRMVKPKHYIPTHGTLPKLASAVELARSEGYVLGESVHLMQDGQRLKIEEKK